MIIFVDSINRVGGAVESNDFYNEGSFEFIASTNAISGVAMAFWTFYYEDNGNVNHEIDFELYGDNNIIYSSYISETSSTHIYDTLDYIIHNNEFHTYRFDWYNGEKVEYYIDNILVATITENIPTKPMKVWIGAWCPSWAGEPMEGDFTMTVKSFKYTSF